MIFHENRSIDGRKIVIIGVGDIGCETADWLAGPERQVAVRVKQVMAVGDAQFPGNLGAALRSASAAALNI